MTTWEERLTRHEPSPPRLDLLDTCWRFVGPSKRVFVCEIYETDIGLEVRASYSLDDIIRTQYAVDIETAREVADEWRRAVLAKGRIRSGRK